MTKSYPQKVIMQIGAFCCIKRQQVAAGVVQDEAPTSYKWTYNPYQWPEING